MNYKLSILALSLLSATAVMSSGAVASNATASYSEESAGARNPSSEQRLMEQLGIFYHQVDRFAYSLYLDGWKRNEHTGDHYWTGDRSPKTKSDILNGLTSLLESAEWAQPDSPYSRAHSAWQVRCFWACYDQLIASKEEISLTREYSVRGAYSRAPAHSRGILRECNLLFNINHLAYHLLRKTASDMQSSILGNVRRWPFTRGQ